MRYAITGWAWRTPLGPDIQRACARMRAGERAAIRNTVSSHYPTQLVAPIRDKPAHSRNERLVSEIALHAIEVANEAFAMAKCETGDRMGLYVGMGGLRAGWQALMPAMKEQVADATGSWHKGLRSMHPLWMLRYLSNNAHGLISAQLDIVGEGLNMSGPDGGAQAYHCATRALRLGIVDRALVVAYDTLLAPEILVEETLHREFVPGEAAVAVVLEPLNEHPSEAVLAEPGFHIESSLDAQVATSMGTLGAAMSLVQVVAHAACAGPEIER